MFTLILEMALNGWGVQNFQTLKMGSQHMEMLLESNKGSNENCHTTLLALTHLGTDTDNNGVTDSNEQLSSSCVPDCKTTSNSRYVQDEQDGLNEYDSQSISINTLESEVFKFTILWRFDF